MTELPVQIVRSDRRKRTLHAQVVDGAIRVRVPSDMPADDERRLVADLVGRIRKKVAAGEVDLSQRARHLAARYELPEPTSIVWSARQEQRWGSCTPSQGTIRISNRLASVPDFVLDYVIVHELAHLEVRGHGPEFHRLIARYPLTERATGFLMAMGMVGGQ